MSKKIVALSLMLVALAASQSFARSVPIEFPVEPVPLPVRDGGIRRWISMDRLAVRYMEALRRLPRLSEGRKQLPRLPEGRKQLPRMPEARRIAG